MRRPADWSPLARDSDPVPGDPDTVERSGRDYLRVAQAIETAALRLRQIADRVDMRSDAVDALRDKAGDVASDIERAHERYHGVGVALVGFAGPLRQAQADSARALRDAEAAQERLAAARHQADTARTHLGAAVTAAAHAPARPAGATPSKGPDIADLRASAATADRAVQDALDDLAAAKTLCGRAESDRDHAADAAIKAIHAVEDSGDLNDSWWDNWGAKVVGWVASIAGAVASFAGVAALVVGWIPVIGQALAAVLGTVALVAAALSLIANFALASTGYGSWTSVVLDAVSLATFGVGRAVSVGARAAYQGTRATARLAAGSLAATSRASRAATALPTAGSSRAVIRTLVGSEDVAGLSRVEARRALDLARREPTFAWRAPLTSARRDLAGLPRQASVLARGSSWSRAVDGTPGAFSALAHSRSTTEVLARLTQNEELLQHLSFVRGMHPGLTQQVTRQLARAESLTLVESAATATGSTLDGYQTATFFAPDGPAPAETLHLPGDPHGR